MRQLFFLTFDSLRSSTRCSCSVCLSTRSRKTPTRKATFAERVQIESNMGHLLLCIFNRMARLTATRLTSTKWLPTCGILGPGLQDFGRSPCCRRCVQLCSPPEVKQTLSHRWC